MTAIVERLRYRCPLRGTQCWADYCDTGCAVHPDNQGLHHYVPPMPIIAATPPGAAHP